MNSSNVSKTHQLGLSIWENGFNNERLTRPFIHPKNIQHSKKRLICHVVGLWAIQQQWKWRREWWLSVLSAIRFSCRHVEAQLTCTIWGEQQRRQNKSSLASWHRKCRQETLSVQNHKHPRWFVLQLVSIQARRLTNFILTSSGTESQARLVRREVCRTQDQTIWLAYEQFELFQDVDRLQLDPQHIN